MDSSLKNVLLKIARRLNEAKVTWAVGASVVLDYYELIEESPHDIDIVVKVDDIERADALLTALGQKKVWEKSNQYSTPYFYEYEIEAVEVDVMGLLTINTPKGKFEYPFDQNSIKKVWIEDGIEIPLTSLEDWFVLYSLMDNRMERVKCIENYLKRQGIVSLPLEAELKKQGVMPNALMDRLLVTDDEEKPLIRKADPSEFIILNDLAFSSEAHWGYDESFMNDFKTFYAINSEYISENPTFVYSQDRQIKGFYSLKLKGRFCELEYFYVKPDYIGKGIGEKLWQHMVHQCSDFEVEVITWVTSPEAKTFYEKMGAAYSGDVPSHVKEDKMIPKLYYKLDWINKMKADESKNGG